MGVTISHGAYSGSCGYFNLWRKEIARHIGMNLFEMDGYKGKESWIKWESHPLCPLLRHSDNSGELSLRDLKMTLAGLEEIKDKVDYVFKHTTEDFIDGCKKALEDLKPLTFI
jgi:hypothetical protein